MGFSNELPEGMEDLGPSQDLAQNHPELLGASGQPVGAPSVKAPPVEWIKDEELTTNPKKPYYYPKLDTPLATEYGSPRQGRLFYPGEREMFIQVFAMHISDYLFGIPCIIAKEDENTTWFEPNPAFKDLPCIDIDEPEIE